MAIIAPTPQSAAFTVSLRSDIRSFARAGDDGLRHGKLHRAERDGEHGNDVQNSAKRSVVRRAKQTADQDVEEEI